MVDESDLKKCEKTSRNLNKNPRNLDEIDNHGYSKSRHKSTKQQDRKQVKKVPNKPAPEKACKNKKRFLRLGNLNICKGLYTKEKFLLDTIEGRWLNSPFMKPGLQILRKGASRYDVRIGGGKGFMEKQM